MTQTGTHQDSLNAEQVGYKQSLGRRHVQMIAIGGAIGTGLFLGSASRLHSTGPALLLSYAFVGVIAYFLMRCLGELVLHRATSGAFVSYMREFYGESAAFVTGLVVLVELGSDRDRRAVGRGAVRAVLVAVDADLGHGVDRAGGGVGHQLVVGAGVRGVRVRGGDREGRRDRDLPGGRVGGGDRPVRHRRARRRGSRTCGPTRVASGRPWIPTTGTARSW